MKLKDEDEKRIFDKYIKPYTGILSRIKTKLLIRYRRKRIRTVDDFDFFTTHIIIKVVLLILVIGTICALGSLIWDAYLWFFPPASPGGSSNHPYFIPVIVTMLRGE